MVELLPLTWEHSSSQNQVKIICFVNHLITKRRLGTLLLWIQLKIWILITRANLQAGAERQGEAGFHYWFDKLLSKSTYTSLRWISKSDIWYKNKQQVFVWFFTYQMEIKLSPCYLPVSANPHTNMPTTPSILHFNILFWMQHSKFWTENARNYLKNTVTPKK